MRDTTPRECPVCHGSFVPRKAHQQVCSATCRKRKQRGTYVVTEEDRAAIRRVLERMGHGHPMERPLTEEQVREHVLRTAERT